MVRTSRGARAIGMTLIAMLALPVQARVGAATSTTSSTTGSTTSTTAGPSTSTTPAETTTTTVPSPDPRAQLVDPETGDALPEDSPAAAPVPPSPVPTVAPPAEPARRVDGLLSQARAEHDQHARRLAEARAEVDRLRGEVAAAAERREQLAGHETAAVRRLVAARAQVRRNAVRVYTGGDVGHIDVVLRGGEPADLTRRVGFVSQLLKEQRRAVERLEQAKQEVGGAVAEAVATEAMRRSDLKMAQTSLLEAELAAATAADVTAALAASRDIVGRNFVFPVGGDAKYSSTFGAPRMFGTPFAHLHQGTDMFAPTGTPLLACERGIVTRVGTDRLGGIKLWIAGESGTRYYYAHLSGYAAGIAEGVVVEAGTVVGYVGNTGNAITTPAHLHFEVHPGGGAAIDPYPILRAVDPRP